MIKIPSTYGEWVDVLNMLKNKSNDEEVLHVMQQGKLEWQTGVAERFTEKYIGTINYRLDNATDKFQTEINRASGRESMIIQALLNLRKELVFLSKVANIEAVPEKYRSQYYNMVINHADSIQKSLEDSAKKDRTGKLSSIIRNHKVTIN